MNFSTLSTIGILVFSMFFVCLAINYVLKRNEMINEMEEQDFFLGEYINAKNNLITDINKLSTYNVPFDLIKKLIDDAFDASISVNMLQINVDDSNYIPLQVAKDKSDTIVVLPEVDNKKKD